MADAVVIGAGPNGLVAANLLVDAGWSVELLEAQDTPGGAVRHDHGVDPDFTSDVFSAFYPLAAASRVLDDLHLEHEELAWSHAPKVLAHPLPDGRCAVLSRDLEETAASLDVFAPGDGPAWESLWRVWERLRKGILDALFTPFPPIRAGAGLALRLRGAGGLRLARTMMLPVRRLGEEEFRGEGGRLLLAGNALHADLAPEAAGSGGFGWLMSMLGQTYGFPVPVGGSGALSGALARRLTRRGGTIRCGEQVTEVAIRGGRAVGVRTASGEGVPARRAVLADVSAPALYSSLVAEEHLPSRLLADLKRFQWDFATFKVDWALNDRVPWSCPEAAQAGTIHLADGIDALTRFASQIAMGRVPDQPFCLFGQMTTADPNRSPRGTEAAWAYTHVPQQVRGDAGDDTLTGSWDTREQAAFADRVEAHVERYAPRVPRPRPGPAHPRPAHAGEPGRQPAPRRHQRWHHRPAPTARLPAQSRHRPPGDTRPWPVSGLRLRAPGRRSPRRPWGQCRTGRPASTPNRGSLPPPEPPAPPRPRGPAVTIAGPGGRTARGRPVAVNTGSRARHRSRRLASTPHCECGPQGRGQSGGCPVILVIICVHRSRSSTLPCCGAERRMPKATSAVQRRCPMITSRAWSMIGTGISAGPVPWNMLPRTPPRDRGVKIGGPWVLAVQEHAGVHGQTSARVRTRGTPQALATLRRTPRHRSRHTGQ